ncbi:hypothetical protein SAMN04488518_11983 [Pseudovibrio ascidiaceicola]|uniref:Uncharacterized protein n=1 Tax=Pseudovibrio ascidiaceicola TaxID=285279 RepID=A0A1I4FM36_9HYPH|nr:hypothetical protein [Pseudovibrio ascidiaceicola]SFL17926.1 hypothetical protein SAMN04488518_11983 [Pseudovibrio ascidiaceicola]
MPSVNPGTAILNGENPFIWLSETRDGPRTSEASLWTITYSLYGAGHALFIKSGLTKNEVGIGPAEFKAATELRFHRNAIS